MIQANYSTFTQEFICIADTLHNSSTEKDTTQKQTKHKSTRGDSIIIHH